MSNQNSFDAIRAMVDYALSVEIVIDVEIPHTYIPYYIKNGETLYLGVSEPHGDDPYMATKVAIAKAVDQILGL